MNKSKSSIPLSNSHFSKILVELLKGHINKSLCLCKSPIKHSKSSQILRVLLLDILKHYLPFWADLKHFHNQADEWTWFSHASITASNVLKSNCSINERCFIQSKALLRVVLWLVDFCPHNFINQELRICSMNFLCTLKSSVWHFNE